MIKRLVVVATLASTLVASATWAGEAQDRVVDKAAISSQELAISRLNNLLRKYRGTSQEPVLLAKLAEFQQQQAAILFRIAHGAAHSGRKAPDLSRHHKLMGQSIDSLNRLIAVYPGYEEIAHAYYLRAKAYEEIDKKEMAGKDYLHLVKHFPNAEEAVNSYMSLAEFATQANDHPRAITFLKEVEKRPEDPHYPFALYKLAWAHYNLGKIPEALGFAERQIHFYAERKARAEGAFNDASDTALRENTLLDMAIFYFQGYETKIEAYSVKNALAYFKKFEKGPVLGRVLLRFGKLLRSHKREADIMYWKDQVLASRPMYPEALDLLILTYEYQLNNQHYDKVVACAKDMVEMRAAHKEFESFPKAQKQVLDTAEGLQRLVIKNKDASEVRAYSKILAQIYDAFVHLVEETDPRIPRVHYNLAETLFTIRDYEGATEHYRWVVEHGKWNAKPVAVSAKGGKKADEGATVPDASLKAIGSHYEVLQAKNMIPKELKPRAITSKSPPDLDPLLGKWVGWIDEHYKHVEAPALENFAFEANRALYAAGQTQMAVDRMAKFAAKYPKSHFAIPAASLVLDTHIASANWETTQELAEDFMDVEEWKKGDFGKKLFVIASDAAYKQIEAKFREREYKATLKGCEKFVKRYGTSPRLGDALGLAGTSALELGDRPKAGEWFSRLIKETPGNSNLNTALLARASINEDKYLFAAAASDYRAYVDGKAKGKSPDHKELRKLARKALALAWLTGDQAFLGSMLSDKAICVEDLAEECEKYSILNKIAAAERFPSGGNDAKVTEDAFERSRKDSAGDNRALWAILALQGSKHLAFRDRNVVVRHAVSGWSDLDPLVKFAMIPHLSQLLPQAFRLNRAALKEVAPLKAHEKWITRRVEVIREMENAATKVMKLPWARIRAETLNEIAGIYLDLSRGLASLSPPKGLSADEMQAYEDVIRKLTMPFEEKGQEMRGKAFEIASKFAIEEDSYKAIAEPFFAENPSQAKALKKDDKAAPPEPLTLAFLVKLDSGGGWKDISRAPASAVVPEELAHENPAQYIKAMWGRAIQNRRLAQVAFFMQEAQEKALIQAGIMSAVKAVSLVAAGARGEAFAELEDAKGDLEDDGKELVTTFLVAYRK